MKESEKMQAGYWYDANNDPELIEKRIAAKNLCFDLDHTRPSNTEKRQEIIQQLLGNGPENLELISPFMCDYGHNIQFGKNVFVNSSCYFMDCATISVGNHVYIGPSCGFYTAKHPLDYATRNSGLEQALPIAIGDNVWFGANVTVLPGVTIGAGCVIAAGSVVTKDIEPNSLAGGVPCRIFKKVSNDQEEDI